MKEFKGTKGDWSYKYNGASFKVGEKSQLNGINGEVCDLKIHNYYNLELTEVAKKRAQANAKLIASAPDLLKALIKYHEMAERHTMPTETELEMLSIESKQAINKALN